MKRPLSINDQVIGRQTWRYEVCCPSCCEETRYRRKKQEAIDEAKRHIAEHQCRYVNVLDHQKGEEIFEMKRDDLPTPNPSLTPYKSKE